MLQQITRWKNQALEYLQAAFAKKLEVKEVINNYEAELYKQIGQLKVENDFLKKIFYIQE